MIALRIGLAALFLMVAVTVQTSVLSNIAVAGVTCDLTLIVVIALALSRGPEWGAIAGFAGGLLLDIVPPADHTAGRWALSLAIAGYVAGLIRRQNSSGPVGPLGVALTVVLGTAISFFLYSATGSLLHDPSVDWGQFGVRLGISAGYDVVGAIVVIPLVMWIMGRVQPARERRVAP
ncbi:rod shape-determining protein MreD [Kribbella solani]|uniref:Rod shape-determining protein MreD n=1 Tax=Kribbella solani TaxID=236067 RepID=A0A841DLX5_9ACTN|nr:rod shape-determining protein MreD [Kribbella solani]MBB5979663.1 rod shape-determining protein MreD [Kribbella solani]MDX2971043.1 rod shape-determining protein MreD [Kribbella solani]MDX3004668.1 rod shape-determining protein MreD [Kribbella solani]